jgi:hypothetical protein
MSIVFYEVTGVPSLIIAIFVGIIRAFYKPVIIIGFDQDFPEYRY